MSGSLTATSFVKSGVTAPQNYLLQADGGHVLKSSFSGSGHTHAYLPLTGGRLTTGIGDVNIELWRGTNASWNILNSGGYLSFQSNYTTVVGAYFDALKLDYNTGNALFKGTVTAPTFIGALSGNASTATTLATTRAINGTNFNGSAAITTARWGTARNIGVVNSDGTGTAVVTSVNGSGNLNLKLPATIKASLTGNATTATNIANSGTVTLATATESNSITITQPSYVSGKPVKLLNFNWYATT